MPISRKKSCIPCRAAKARCNIASPCSRCSERGIPCNYADIPLLSDEVSPRASEAELMQLDEIVEADLQIPLFSGHGHMYDFEYAGNIHQNPTTIRAEDNGCSNSDLSNSDLFDQLVGSPTRGTYSDTPELLNQRRTFSQASVGHLQTQLEEISHARGAKENGYFFLGHDDFILEGDERLMVIRGKVFRDILSPRKLTSTQSFLTTQVLWGQLNAYPQLLIQGQLPPFIYPSCVLDDKLPKNCVVNGVHQCLPDSLAVCASLISMFYGRTPVNSSFVWKIIYSELSRLKTEYQGYNNIKLLSAVQSISIYSLLQAQDHQSISQNNVGSMIDTLIDIAKQLTQSTTPTYNIHKKENTTQRDWAFNESMRRTFCLLYVLENLLEAVIARQDLGECGGFNPIPLPGPRFLWNYNSSEGWAHRLDRFRAGSLSDMELTLGDLKNVGHGRGDDREVDLGLVEKIARWCEGIDELGSLVYMVSVLD